MIFIIGVLAASPLTDGLLGPNGNIPLWDKEYDNTLKETGRGTLRARTSAPCSIPLFTRPPDEEVGCERSAVCGSLLRVSRCPGT